MRTRWVYAAVGMLLLSVAAPGRAQSHLPDRDRVHVLVKQVYSAGTWEQQAAVFAKLSERERIAVWLALTDVRPGEVCCG